MKLTDYLRETDATPTIEVNYNLGTSLKRAEIEEAISSAGYPYPSRNVLFYILDNRNHVYMVRYFASVDKFGVERLALK